MTGQNARKRSLLKVGSQVLFILALTSVVVGCGETQESGIKPEKPNPHAKPGHVKVAAIQCYSHMGKVAENCRLLEQLVRKAAEGGAKIAVLPEAAVTGYMDPSSDLTWTSKETAGADELALKPFAESVPGPSSKRFAALAKELEIFVTIPLVEVADGKYYNTVLLADPSGKVVAHHRKQAMWLPGDSGWCTKGDLPAQVVETPYGRLGLMICYDWNVMPEKLAKRKVDVVLYSVGWFGPNTKDWYRYTFPKRVVIPNDFAVIAANWSGGKNVREWEGQGYSCVIGRDGAVLNMAEHDRGPTIVYAELPVTK